MKLDPMKEALKKRAHKASFEKGEDAIEEAGESPAEEKAEKDKEALGLAPDTESGKNHPKSRIAPHLQAPDAPKVTAENLADIGQKPDEGAEHEPDGHIESIVKKMGDMGNTKGSLSNKAKEAMKLKLSKKA